MDPFHTWDNSAYVIYISQRVKFKARVDLQKRKLLSNGILIFSLLQSSDLLFVTCIPLDAYKDDGVGEVTPSRQQKLGVSVSFWWTDLSDFFKSIFGHACIFLLFSSFFCIFHVF